MVRCHKVSSLGFLMLASIIIFHGFQVCMILPSVRNIIRESDKIIDFQTAASVNMFMY